MANPPGLIFEGKRYGGYEHIVPDRLPAAGKAGTGKLAKNDRLDVMVARGAQQELNVDAGKSLGARGDRLRIRKITESLLFWRCHPAARELHLFGAERTCRANCGSIGPIYGCVLPVPADQSILQSDRIVSHKGT